MARHRGGLDDGVDLGRGLGPFERLQGSQYPGGGSGGFGRTGAGVPIRVRFLMEMPAGRPVSRDLLISCTTAASKSRVLPVILPHFLSHLATASQS